MILDKEYRILVIDDAKDTQMLLEFDLSAASYLVDCCDCGEDAISFLKTQEVDLILLDMYMPGLTGLETLEILKSDNLTSNIPVIMLSASTDEDEVVAALELGAGDYVVKPYVAKVLFARIRTAIRLQEKTAQLEYLAKTDFLTGINNRGCFFELSTNALNLANRSGQPIVLAMFDIDFFKPINDNYGHDAGDEVLRVFSKGLTEVFRGYDIIGRVGGEEFAVCLPNATRETATIACERFRDFVEKLSVSVTSGNNTKENINITVSVGLVLADNKQLNIDELLKKADTALYYAKDNGRNQVVDFSRINSNGAVKDYEIMNIDDTNNSSDNVQFEGVDFDIGVNNVLGDESLFKEILVMFYQDHHQDGEKLEKAIEEKDMPTLKHLAHTLKGVASSVGAMNLFEVTKKLDVAVNENKMEELSTLFSQVSSALSIVMQSISSNLDINE